jgi:prepilin-type N-terminal cleavage/methylation domain-containing protein
MTPDHAKGTVLPLSDPSSPVQRSPSLCRDGFSLLELLISIAVIALLVSMLLPALAYARETGYRAVCANNLRQMNIGWQGYLQDHKESFPVAMALPEWNYGGVTFVGSDKRPVLDAARPINRYLSSAPVGQTAAASDASKLFHCPSDSGVWQRDSLRRGAGVSILGQAGGERCYDFYGNSYCANTQLFGSGRGPDVSNGALRLSDIQTDTSRLLIAGDAAWRFALPETAGEGLEASWHRTQDCGNFLAADGSIRFVNFAQGLGREFTVSPRP